MRKLMPFVAVGLCTMLGMVASADAGPKDEASCGQFGTSLEFEKTPSEAARKALKQEKLVFVLHVSGYFEDAAFT